MGERDARERLAAEIRRLEMELAALDRDWRRIPWLCGLFSLTLPAWWYKGAAPAGLVALGVCVLISISTYIVAAHRSDHRHRLEKKRMEMKRC